MVVRKLFFIVVSLVNVNLNLVAGNNAFNLETIDQLGLAISQNDKHIERTHVDYKRNKREDDTLQVSYILNGFLENGTIPVDFPQDICLFDVNGILYASVLHFSAHPQETQNQTTILTIFKNEGNGKYVEILNHETKSAKDMDCLGVDGAGYVAISNTIENDMVDLNEASPVFQVTANSVNVVQYFSTPFQNKVYLRRYGRRLYFMQLFLNKPKEENRCPIFQWSSNHFDLIDELPCTSAMKMDMFVIDSDIYIALANNKDEFGEIATFSYIYKFNIELNRFLLHQQIRTNAAVDVKHFNIKEEHFLVFANSYKILDNGEKNYETQSVIYKLSDDYFTPFQTITLYDVVQFLPVMGPQNEFVLLVSCKKQPTKSWQYNGWMFYESDIQFTGGALGEGVSSMRAYFLRGKIAVVVANTFMLKEANNIFFPQFVQKERPRVLQDTIESWCDANRIEEEALETAKKLAIDLEKFPMKRIPGQQIVDEVNFLEEVNIGTITTKLLRLNGKVFDQQLVNRINEMNELIKELDKRLENIETKKRNSFVGEPKQETLFEYDDNILHSDAQIVKAPLENVLDSLELGELTIENFNEIQFINGHAFEDLVFTDKDLNVSEVVVDELILKNYENYLEIIGNVNKNFDEEDMAAAASENFAAPATNVLDNVKVNSLLVDGLVNRLDISMLNEFALKTRGDQVLESQINFGNLQAKSLQASEVSNREIKDIARTVNGPFTVAQSVQFSSPISINKLIVNQRINNINVINGDFNILLKRSDHDQVIQAMQIFDEVKLLNPIVLQGKITESNLDKINPIISITDDITLEGDYEIRGNTTIIRVIRGENFYGKDGVYNVRDLLADGLRLNTSVIEQIFEFVQPIKVTNLLSNSVNNVDVSKFVRTGEIHTVYGTKNFTGDLHVDKGVCEAFAINDIDLAVLNETTLKRSGAQKIDGKINFNSIRLKRASAKTINLFGHKISDFLTKIDQIILGNVTIHGNLILNNIHVENIRTNNKICNFDLETIIQDTITTNVESHGSAITGEKFFRNQLILENVQVGGDVFGLGTMDSLLGYVKMLSDYVQVNGSITLTNNLKVDRLSFAGSINGISSGDFGNQWLLSETDQDFILPQTVFTIRTEENVILNGSLNNIDVVNQFSITQFKDQPINFTTASFARTIFQQPITLNGLVSGIKFPNDIVLKDADFIQYISYAAVNDINISGKITVEERISNINYNVACDLLLPDSSAYGLIIERDAIFHHTPQIENLNGQNLNQLYNEVWFSNENVVLTGALTFAQVQLSKPIVIKGLLNGNDVGYLSNHFVSLSEPKEIVAEIEINGNVLFQNNIRSGSIQVNGVVRDSLSGSSIKIEEFDRSVLKRGVNQEITGDWYIASVNVAGDINTLINGFDMAVDVVRYSNINTVTAEKTFESIAVSNINCHNGCTFMDVDLVDWISKVAFVGLNYTIQGTTVMEAPVFYDNLNVFGPVNNLIFTQENVLLKSVRQTINGNVFISNKSYNDQRILPLSFVDVQVDSINGKILNEFYLNIVYNDVPLSPITTRLEFKQLLTVDFMQLYADFNGFDLNELIKQVQMYQVFTNYNEHLEHMNIIGNAIVDELKTKKNYLATYRLQQVIFGNIKKILTVEVATPEETFDVFVMLNVSDVNGFLNFYVFDRETSALALANSLFGFQPKDMLIVDIFSIVISDRDFLVVQTQNHFSRTFGHSFFTHFKGQFRNVYEIHGNVSREIVGLNMGTDDCFIMYSRRATNVAIACAFFNKPGTLGFQQVDELYLSSGVVQVRSVTSNNRVEIIVLDLEGRITIWSLDQQHRFVKSQIIKTLHIITRIAVVHHKDFHYLAACSETSSANLGTIDIYISSANAYVNEQTIVIESPVTVELSVIAATNDLVLYVLTDSIAKPLVVYHYTGITKFKEFTTGVTIPRAQRLNVLKAKVMGKELISLISEGVGVLIVEAKVK